MFEVILNGAFVLLMMVLVLIGAYLFSKHIGKFSGGYTRKMRYIQVLDQVPVGQDKFIAVIKAGDDHLLVGITNGQISVLKELDEEQMQTAGAPVENPIPDFRSILEKMVKRGDEK